MNNRNWTDAERRAVEVVEAAPHIEARLTVDEVNALAKPARTAADARRGDRVHNTTTGKVGVVRGSTSSGRLVVEVGAWPRRHTERWERPGCELLPAAADDERLRTIHGRVEHVGYATRVVEHRRFDGDPREVRLELSAAAANEVAYAFAAPLGDAQLEVRDVLRSMGFEGGYD